MDAAIIGFAVGTGFALVENVDYLRNLGEARFLVWVVRGFGTAVLHATTAAIIAIAAKSLGDRFPERGWLVVVPGWIAAILLHSLFNHALVSPVLAAAMLLLVLPIVVISVFGRSERKTREWVGEGLDLDVELLGLVRSMHFGGTRLGRYLNELTSRFPGPVVADMFCLLQLELELAIRAKGMLMAREAGLELPSRRVDQGAARRARVPPASDRTDGPARASAAPDDERTRRLAPVPAEARRRVISRCRCSRSIGSSGFCTSRAGPSF